MHRSLKFLLIVILLSVAPGCVSAENIQVTVDASRPLGPVKQLFRDFGQGGESTDPNYLVPVVKDMKRLHPRIVRIDHIFDFFCKLNVKDGKLVDVDFTNLDKLVDSIIDMGAKPLMCISYVPIGVRSGSEFDPPSDRKMWIELVYRAVRHFNIERKLRIVYWEMWNEPDPNFWRGDLAAFLDWYGATCRAAVRTDSSIKFGGGGFGYFNGHWINALMDHCKANNLRLDFVSWHQYGDRGGGYAEWTKQSVDWLAKRDMKAELMQDEWNLDCGVVPQNDDHNGAAFIAMYLSKGINDSVLDYLPFFEIKDGPNPDARFWGRWGLFTADNHPKANYYTFLAFSTLESERLALTGGSYYVGGTAAGKDGKISVIIYNNYTNKNNETVELKITGIKSPGVKLERFLIDETHSNPARTGKDKGLEMVESRVAKTDGGSLAMTIQMPKASVTMVKVSPTR